MSRVAAAAKKRAKEQPASAVLQHYLRVRILEVLNERDLSPSEFFALEAKNFEGSTYLSDVSYHFRELEKAGCIEVVKEVPVRGAMRHIYRGKARAYFTDAEWSKLSDHQRRCVSRTALQGLVARAEVSLKRGTFDARLDRHLTWISMGLDQRGWDEFTTSMEACFGEVEQIRHDAEKRLADSEEDVIWATFGMLGFESPPPTRDPDAPPEPSP